MISPEIPRSGKLTPLWIIAIFVSFAEAVSGGALVSTSGTSTALFGFI